MPKLCAETIVNNLFALAKHPCGGRHAPFIVADLVDQDTLIEIQDKLAGVLDQLDRERLQREHPYLYERK